MFNSIVVAFDGSDHSETAVRTACDLAGKYGAKLHIVYVPDLYDQAIVAGWTTVTVPVSDEDITRAGQPVIERASAVAQEAGQTPTSVAIRKGPPTEAILDFAADKKADLIVAGRRGRGQLSGLLLGSVSQKLAAHAACPVLTVK